MTLPPWYRRASRWLLCVPVGLVIACGGSSGASGPSRTLLAIIVTGGRDTLYVGQTMSLAAIANYSDSSSGPANDVQWTSSDTTRATVTGAGIVTAHAPGPITILARSGGRSGARATTVLTVPVSSVGVSPASRLLYVGQAVQFTATARDSVGGVISGRPVAWLSRDTTILKASVSGLATGLRTGGVTLVATIDGHSDSATVTVGLVPVSSVSILPAGDTASVGDTLRPIAVARDSGGTVIGGRPVTWSTTDSSVLTPAGSGVFVAGATGAVTLTASVGGKSVQGAIQVATCSDTAQLTSNAYWVPHAAGELLPGISATNDIGLFRSTPVIYAGGMLVGTDSAHMLVAYDPTGTIGPGSALAGVCASSPGYTYTKVRPAYGVGAPPGVRIVEETYAPSASAADSGIVLIRYTITDTAAYPVTNLRVGYFVDWDLNYDNNPGQDMLRYFSSLGLAEAQEPDTTVHPARFAVIPIPPSGASTYNGWTNGGAPGDPATRGAFYARLAQGSVTATIGPQDIRQLSGAGPFTIPAYGKLVVYFALVGGTDASSFSASRARAVSLANALGFN